MHQDHNPVSQALTKATIPGKAAVRAMRATALAAAVSLAMPALETAIDAAPAAYAEKRTAKTKPKSAAARKRQIERALERARARVIPSRATPARTPPPAAKTTATTPPDPARDGKPLTLKEKKSAVLNAPPELLKRIGRHVIVGYYAHYQLTPLLERGAIGGVFVTTRNARRRSKATLAEELTSFRKMATDAGQKTFWLATDQEGGSVSRLSPPLPYQPSLRNLLRKTKPEAHDEAVKAFAARQAKALADIGINLNFAPVADINHNVRAPRDRHTRIRYRAISTDPEIVTKVVRTYCEELDKAGVYCTLKHFPGIGRIAADTHITSARLKTATDVLEKTDWVPFREVMGTTPAFVMIGHPHLESVDASRPASTSPDVIQKLLRDTWKFDGIVVTDDLAMGAIKRRYEGGMAKAALDAMNAGADLVLIGSDGDDVYDVIYTMMLAHEQGRLDDAKLVASEKRLLAAAARIKREDPAPAHDEMPKTAASKTDTARQ